MTPKVKKKIDAKINLFKMMKEKNSLVTESRSKSKIFNAVQLK